VNVGALEDGATWQYSIDDGANWTAGSGTSFTLAGDGAKSVIVRQTDSAGNVSPASAPFGFTLDTTGPSETISSTIVTDSGQAPTIGFAGVTNDNTLGLSGTVDDNLASVDVYYNGGTLLGHATVDSGTWSFTTAPLADGNYSFAIEVTDAAGNMTYTSAVPATVDTTASAPSLALATDSGSSSSDKITNNGTVNVSGLEAGATWQYSTDGGTNWTAGSGASFTLAGDGAKSVTVRQTDSAGNVSPASAPFGFTLDTTGPSETISSTIVTDSGQAPTIGFAGVTNDNTLGLSGTVDDDLASVDVYYNGGTLLGSATVDSGNWSFTTAPLADGNYSFAIEVTDAAGNMTYTSAVPATVDTTASAPSLSLATDSGSSSSDKITNNGTVNVSGLEAGATWQYSIDDGANWTAGSGTSFTLAGDGAKSVIVRQTDSAGNVSPASGPFGFTLDTTGPSETISSTIVTDSGQAPTIGFAGVTNDNTLGLSGTVDDNLASVDVYYNGGTLLGSATVDSGNWSFTTAPLADGNYSFAIEVTDAAGNMTYTSAVPATVDTTASAPSLSLATDSGSSNSDRITNNGTVNVGGLEAGATWQYSIDDGANWTAGSGTSFTLAGDGAKSVIVRQTDSAGNVSPAS